MPTEKSDPQALDSGDYANMLEELARALRAGELRCVEQISQVEVIRRRADSHNRPGPHTTVWFKFENPRVNGPQEGEHVKVPCEPPPVHAELESSGLLTPESSARFREQVMKYACKDCRGGGQDADGGLCPACVGEGINPSLGVKTICALCHREIKPKMPDGHIEGHAAECLHAARDALPRAERERLRRLEQLAEEP